MSTSRATALLLLGSLLLARTALAQAPTQAAPPAAAPVAPAPLAPPPAVQVAPSADPDHGVRVRASHRVDVIAPGEKIETVLDRMRSTRAPPAANDARPVERLPVRGPDRGSDKLRDNGRGPEGPRGPGDGHGPPGGGPHSDGPHR